IRRSNRNLYMIKIMYVNQGGKPPFYDFLNCPLFIYVPLKESNLKRFVYSLKRINMRLLLSIMATQKYYKLLFLNFCFFSCFSFSLCIFFSFDFFYRIYSVKSIIL